LRASTVEITFQPKNVAVDAEPGESLKDIMEEVGVPCKYKCTNGQCGTCESELFNPATKRSVDIRPCIYKVPNMPKSFTVYVNKEK